MANGLESKPDLLECWFEMLGVSNQKDRVVNVVFLT